MRLAPWSRPEVRVGVRAQGDPETWGQERQVAGSPGLPIPECCSLQGSAGRSRLHGGRQEAGPGTCRPFRWTCAPGARRSQRRQDPQVSEGTALHPSVHSGHSS